jgi:hypothetical protein
MKAISYSLFGYNKARQDHCFDFASYLRGLMISIRMNRLIYPGWTTVLNTDKQTYEAFKDLFDNISDLEVYVNDPDPLCKAMLWRLKPIYVMNGDKPKFTHVICRDLDSPCTYKERQAVQYWIDRGTAIHAITDSESHNIPMMGGMIGINTALWTLRMPNNFKELMRMGSYDYDRKGTDQTFLNQCVYPIWASKGNESITQHYFWGMANTFLNDFHTCDCPKGQPHESRCLNNYEIDLDYSLSESTHTSGHIGASGWYETAMFKFLKKHWDKFEDLLELEAKHPKIFYWVNE